MPRILPPDPHLDHLRNEAKALLRAHGNGDAAACTALRLLHRFKDASDEEILQTSIALNEAQFALAMDYGFRSWEDLRKHVLTVSRAPAGTDEARPGALRVNNAPVGQGNSNRYARGFALTLAHSGASCDYDAIMGDSGLAFILQADEHVTPWGKPIRRVDIGWWPLAWWGALIRLEFLGQTVGRRLMRVPLDESLRRSDPARHFRERFQAGIAEALRAGRLPLAFSDHCWVIIGMDDGEPPLLGQRSVSDERERLRARCYPDEVIIVGDEIERLPREQADIEALRFAVALGRDRVEDRIRLIPRCSGQAANLPPRGRYTGQQAFALWARLLRDPDLWGEHFYHANVVLHLRINRKSAGAYLRAMAERHSEPTSSHLRAAANIYEQILDRLSSADIGKEALHAAQGREALAGLVDEMAELESEALGRLEKSLAAAAT